MKKLLLIGALCISSFSFAQKAIQLPKTDPKVIEDAINKSKDSPNHFFAVPVDVSYTVSNSGIWQENADGSRVWKARFTSSGAKNLLFWLRNVTLPKGSLLTVYPNGGQHNADVYDERNLSGADYLGLWPVYGDDVWLEYFEPSEARGLGGFEIFRAGVGYRDIYAKSGPVAPPSLECNYDVECFIDGIENLKNHNKKSVALILGDTGETVFLASGALVNNTANDGKPYILSADHAWVDNTLYTFRFNWRNPDPDCPSAGWGDQSINDNQTISGAILRARRVETDFVLMEIDSELPEEWDLVWSGWDRSGIAPPSTYCIHHPAGDIMKICVDVESPAILNQENGHLKWLVDHWETGTTEGGSSGSPLFTDQGRIIGQLWAGSSGCNGNEPNALGDGYGRFDKSWDEGSTPEARLKEWLDPGNTGAVTLDFYPPLPEYGLDGALKFVDTGHGTCDSQVESVIRVVNNGNIPITSATIEYSMNGNSPQQTTWEGTLQENESAILYLPLVTGLDGENIFSIGLNSVNGLPDENEQNDVISTSFEKWIFENNPVTIDCEINNFGQNIAWVLTDEDGDVVYTGGPYINYLFSLIDGCYRITIYGDNDANGYFSMASGENIIFTADDFSDTQSMSFMLETQLGIEEAAIGIATIYPNPSSGVFSVLLAHNDEAYYNVFNPIGQEVANGNISGKEHTINISGFASGMYIVNIILPTGNTGSYKLIKQ